MGPRVSPGTGQLRDPGVGGRSPKEPAKPGLAQNLIRSDCGFQTAQFVIFIIEQSLHTTTATQVEFCNCHCVCWAMWFFPMLTCINNVKVLLDY